MAQVINVTVTGKNGSAYTSPITTGFPASSILIEAVSFPELLPSGVANPLYGSVSQITVLASNTLYYSEETAADLIDLCNAVPA